MTAAQNAVAWTPGDTVRTLPSKSATVSPPRKLAWRTCGSTSSGRGRTWNVFPGTDGRVVRVRLTAEGTALEAMAAEVQCAVVDHTHLDADELARLRTDLHSLIERMRPTTTTTPTITTEGALP